MSEIDGWRFGCFRERDGSERSLSDAGSIIQRQRHPLDGCADCIANVALQLCKWDILDRDKAVRSARCDLHFVGIPFRTKTRRYIDNNG
ncbi:hypothetical protein GCM10011395_06210 [Sphingomonas psychrolutea]|uniref:Uncharacterized protein n=1 Tax=Sphingomonas psychrolutea TaxID=1259676 RepID=A0ABQ1G889_9SPHN|nr:hypothetical protein GCM10011395_06210 [Sphingomonas psychrolutea]